MCFAERVSRGSVCLLLTVACCLGPSGCLAEGQEELEGELLARMAEMDCPGALAGVFPAEGEPVRMALGVADVETKEPMTLDMHMCVASVMKPFLGTVVLQLADEGKLSLDDPVSKHVEGVAGGEGITLRMLGNNTSGLFNTIENKAFQQAIMQDPGKAWKPREILEYTRGKEPYFAPGEGWRYSNTNAVLLGLCVERVTGKELGGTIRERVLAPLGMLSTAVPVGEQLPEPHPSAYRHGYEDKVIGYGDVFYDVSDYRPSWAGAAGDMYSTLDDLGRAAKPLATGQLLGRDGKQELHRWVEVGYAGYEYGFAIGRRGGGIGHPGDVPGYNAWVAYFSESDASVVVLTNLSNNKDGTMPAEELAKMLIAAFGIK